MGYNKYQKLQEYINGVPSTPPVYKKGELIEQSSTFISSNMCENVNNYYIKFYLNTTQTISSEATIFTLTYNDGTTEYIKYKDLQNPNGIKYINNPKNIIKWNYYENAFTYLNLSHLGKLNDSLEVALATNNTFQIEQITTFYFGDLLNHSKSWVIYASNSSTTEMFLDFSETNIPSSDVVVKDMFTYFKTNIGNKYFYIKCTQQLKNWFLTNAENIQLPDFLQNENSSYWLVV